MRTGDIRIKLLKYQVIKEKDQTYTLKVNFCVILALPSIIMNKTIFESINSILNLTGILNGQEIIMDLKENINSVPFWLDVEDADIPNVVKIINELQPQYYFTNSNNFFKTTDYKTNEDDILREIFRIVKDKVSILVKFKDNPMPF